MSEARRLGALKERFAGAMANAARTRKEERAQAERAVRARQTNQRPEVGM